MRLNRHGLPIIGEPKKHTVKPQCPFNFAGNRSFGPPAYITTPRKEAAHGQSRKQLQPVRPGTVASSLF